MIATEVTAKRASQRGEARRGEGTDLRFAATRGGALCAAGLAAILMTGCLERVIHITSEPPGALVHLNDQEVGRTPVDVPFQEFGTYDVRLTLDDYEPIHEGARADAPPWEWPGLDFIAMILPIPFRTDVRWHFDLELAESDVQALLDRAIEQRNQFHAEQDGAAAP